MFAVSECIIWFAAFLAVAVATVTVNLLSIILFIKNSNLRTRGMYLVINLTVVDILVGALSTLNPHLINKHIGCKTVIVRLPREGNILVHSFFFWFPLTSLTNITVISLERMHATFRPFRHRVIKKSVYGVTICVVWVLAAIISTGIMLLSFFGKKWSQHQFLWQSYCLFCLFVTCACYASIIVKICCGARPQHHGAARRQRKLTVTLLIMTIVSLLSSWLPYAVATFVFHTTDSIRSLSYTKRMRLNLSLLLLFYTNSFVNPVVYTIRMPKFRKALLLLFRRQQRQNAAVLHLHAR